jgi:beta-glucuronidase
MLASLTRTATRTAIAALAGCAALAATVSQAPFGGSSGSAASQPLAGPGRTLAGEGPGGRTPLGSWTLARDPGNRGLARNWQRGGFAGRPVSLPNVVDPNHITGAAGARNYQGSVAWYRTRFSAPQAGTYALSFTSANFHASVWVDGREVASHSGSYLPFEGRPRLAAGTHTVVVRVDWRDPHAQARAGFHRTWFNWGGLNGEASVRQIGASELADPTIKTTLQPGSPAGARATVTVGVLLTNNGPSRAIALDGTLSGGGQTIPLSFPGRTIDHGHTVALSTTVMVDHPRLWSPGSPSLYALTLAVGQESSFSARVGLRQLTWRSGRLYLNGQRLQLHGATLQEDVRGHADALTSHDQDTLVGELKAIGANAVRSQHPLDPGLLERLDAAGLLVWQGIGPVEGAGQWYSTTPALLRGAEQQARTAVLTAELHPSIFAWNLVDELAGNGRDGEVPYVQALTRWIHAHDPTRMVGVDVWGDHPPARAGAPFREVDAVAETDYTGWYDSPTASAARQVAAMRARLRTMERTFPGRVLLISEFGAESNALNPAGAPGSYAFQSSLLARHIAVYAADPQLSGMLIWNLRDYALNPFFMGGSIHSKLPHVRLIEGLNQKGLFTYGGSAKPAASVVARLFAQLPRS